MSPIVIERAIRNWNKFFLGDDLPGLKSSSILLAFEEKEAIAAQHHVRFGEAAFLGLPNKSQS